MVHIKMVVSIQVKNDDNSKTENINFSKDYDIEDYKFDEPIGSDYSYNPIEVIGGELAREDWENIRNMSKEKVKNIRVK